MNIRFKTLKLKNFLSFENAELSLVDNGFTIVNGFNKCLVDASHSNGSGKSSIWESLIWCLTGETIRGTKDIVNKYSSDGAQVEVEFNIDNNNYRIIRCKDTKEFGTNLFLYVNNVNKSGKGVRDTQKILEETLPDINSQLLRSVIILGQGLPQRFTNNTPSGRKEILEKLSKSDFMIDDIKTKITKRKSELSTNLREAEDTLLSNTTKYDILNKKLQDLKNTKALIVDSNTFDVDIQKYDEQLYSLNMNKTISESLCKELNESIEQKLKEYQDWTSKVNSNYINECNVIDDTYKVADLQSSLNKLEADIKAKKSEIEKLDSIKDVCPTCGQKLPNVHKVDTSNQKVELEALQNKYNEDKLNFDKLLVELDSKKKEILNKLNSDTEEIKNRGKALREEFNKANTHLQEQLKEISSVELTLNKLKLNKENNEKQAKTIDSDIAKTEEDLETLSQEIKYNNTHKDIINEHIDIINKMFALATRDFRGVLLSSVIDYISTRAKLYAIDLFGSDAIDFKLDGNDIYIGYNGKSYESLSGGEKQKADVIIQFSIRDMLSKFLNFTSNILVLDEIFDNLDSMGCQNVMNLISTKLSDIESIFIITHHTDIQISYDNEINIIKNEKGISYIA